MSNRQRPTKPGVPLGNPPRPSRRPGIYLLPDVAGPDGPTLAELDRGLRINELMAENRKALVHCTGGGWDLARCTAAIHYPGCRTVV